MFTYTTFGTTDLPVYNPEFGVGVMASVDVILETAGGTYDAGGDDQLDVMRTVVTHKGTIVASDGNDLQTQVRAARKLRGVKAKLYREWDKGDEEWVYARCIAVEGTRGGGYALHQELTFTFVILSPCWNGDLNNNQVYLNGSTVTDLSNGGDATVPNVIITVTATTTAITNVLISNNDAEIQFAGTISASKQLVIDCGAMSVKNDGVDAYDDFELTSNHEAMWWLPLEPGSNSTTITLTGGSPVSQVGFVFYDGWH